MKLKKVKKLSSKINRLIQDMDHSDEFSLIERALVKKYIINLYEIIANFDDVDDDSSFENDRKAVAKKTKKSSKKSVVDESISEENELLEAIEEAIEAVDQPDELEQQDQHLADHHDTNFLDEIIASFSGGDIAEKLSMQPIKDIYKSMSINERIFTINELFNGQNDAFMGCMDALNNASDMNAAKTILMEKAVIPFEWEEQGKAKKVTKFIQLLYRRFI